MGRSRERRTSEIQVSLELKDYNRCQGRTQPEMFSPTPSTLSLKTMLSSHDRNSDPESDLITTAIDVHTAFLHADVDQDLFAEPPEQDEWYDAGLKEDEVWRLNKSIVRLSQSTKTVAPTPCEYPGKSERPPNPSGSELLPKL